MICGVKEDPTHETVETTEIASLNADNEEATVLACYCANEMTKNHFTPVHQSNDQK